jgi:hypothetical protein
VARQRENNGANGAKGLIRVRWRAVRLLVQAGAISRNKDVRP